MRASDRADCMCRGASVRSASSRERRGHTHVGRSRQRRAAGRAGSADGFAGTGLSGSRRCQGWRTPPREELLVLVGCLGAMAWTFSAEAVDGRQLSLALMLTCPVIGLGMSGVVRSRSGRRRRRGRAELERPTAESAERGRAGWRPADTCSPSPAAPVETRRMGIMHGRGDSWLGGRYPSDGNRRDRDPLRVPRPEGQAGPLPRGRQRPAGRRPGRFATTSIEHRMGWFRQARCGRCRCVGPASRCRRRLPATVRGGRTVRSTHPRRPRFGCAANGGDPGWRSPGHGLRAPRGSGRGTGHGLYRAVVGVEPAVPMRGAVVLAPAAAPSGSASVDAVAAKRPARPSSRRSGARRRQPRCRR